MLLDRAHGIGNFVAASKKEFFTAIETSHVVRADGDLVWRRIHFKMYEGMEEPSVAFKARRQQKPLLSQSPSPPTLPT